MSKPVNIVLDDEGHKKLDILANVYAGGNRSLMVRRLLDARYFEHLAVISNMKSCDNCGGLDGHHLCGCLA